VRGARQLQRRVAVFLAVEAQRQFLNEIQRQRQRASMPMPFMTHRH
jgi:hypothetical protein